MQIHPRRWPEAFVLVLVVAGAATTHAWGPQGHRLVARVASEHLTEVARRNVTWLLGRSALHDVAVWADQQEDRQTATWHYVNIPSDARTYDRRRDCPPPRQTPRDRSDTWRDCVVDRILYNEERLADGRLRPARRSRVVRRDRPRRRLQRPLEPVLELGVRSLT